MATEDVRRKSRRDREGVVAFIAGAYLTTVANACQAREMGFIPLSPRLISRSGRFISSVRQTAGTWVILPQPDRAPERRCGGERQQQETGDNYENHIKIAIVAALGVGLYSTALAQNRPGGPGGPGGLGPRQGQGPGGPPRNAAVAVEHLTQAFATVAPYDVNKDGQLNDTELEALKQAIQNGTALPPGRRTPPKEVGPAHPRGASNDWPTCIGWSLPTMGTRTAC